jgi:hypothetical protein
MSGSGLPRERMERFLNEEIDALCSLTPGQARTLLKELVSDYMGSPVPERGENAGKFIS